METTHGSNNAGRRLRFEVMKRSLAWHEDNLKISIDNCAQLEVELKRIVEYRTTQLELHRKHIKVLTAQIAEAKRRGMNGFDARQFLKSVGNAANAANAER